MPLLSSPQMRYRLHDPSRVRNRPRQSHQGLLRRSGRRRRRLADDRQRRVPRPRGAVGLRQVDAAADDCRPRRGDGRHDLDRRARSDGAAAPQPRYCDGLPELRALPAHDRAPEPRLRAEGAQDAEARDHGAGHPCRGAPGPRRAPRPQAGRPFGRSAPAGRDGTRDRAGAAGLPDGRTALEPRREAPREHARPARGAARATGDDDDLRHARPDRGDDAGTARRGHAGRADPAGGHAAGAVLAALPTSTWPHSSAPRP